MEEQKLTEQESILLITEMISRTKRRKLDNGNIMLLWGYLSVAVATLVWVLLACTHNAVWNWLWCLIWIVGGTFTPIMARKQRREEGASTYVDNISNGLWSMIGFMAIISTFICLAFFFFGGKCSWSTMIVFALWGVGFAEAVQGIVVKMKALVIGGCVGIVSGLTVLAAIAGNVPLYIDWVMPLFIVSFICMMIIPGHIINAKARKAK